MSEQHYATSVIRFNGLKPLEYRLLIKTSSKFTFFDEHNLWHHKAKFIIQELSILYQSCTVFENTVQIKSIFIKHIRVDRVFLSQNTKFRYAGIASVAGHQQKYILIPGGIIRQRNRFWLLKPSFVAYKLSMKLVTKSRQCCEFLLLNKCRRDYGVGGRVGPMWVKRSEYVILIKLEDRVM